MENFVQLVELSTRRLLDMANYTLLEKSSLTILCEQDGVRVLKILYFRGFGRRRVLLQDELKSPRQ